MTYLLDTNVLSELMVKSPQPAVVRRFVESESQMAISAISWHELLFGIGRLPASRRKDSLHAFLAEVVVPGIPVLPYDALAATWHANERARLELRGRTPPFADGQIASVAAVNDLTLVTRNLGDFQAFRNLRLESWHERVPSTDSASNLACRL